MHNVRVTASKIIARVLTQGSSLTEALNDNMPAQLDSRDRAFLQELCYGVIRWYFSLKQLCSYLIKKPLSRSDQDIYALILMGAYQLIYANTPAHAAIFETAEAARSLKKVWAVPLINGVLRALQRQQQALIKKMPKSSQYAHPEWLLKKLQHAWPQDWQTIVEANNHSPPLNLRVNGLQTSRETYLQKLAAEGISATVSDISDVGIILHEHRNVTTLPGWVQGEVSVQDDAAQLAAPLLMLTEHQKLLDACAAPGGKFCHALEMQPNLLKAVAVDRDAGRLKRISENLKRLKLMSDTVKLIAEEAQEFANTCPSNTFERILLDAPCSGTGVIRRHPDIKLLRREADIAKLAQEQKQLLTKLWPLLKPNGILLYVTCSVLPEENQFVVKSFLDHQKNAQEFPIEEKWGQACEVGRQILPHLNGTDGFYYARLLKTIH